MTAEQQAIYLNAVPLLVLGAAYIAAGLSLVPVLVRSRGALRELELALALVFPCGGIAAIVFGAETTRPWALPAAGRAAAAIQVRG